MRVIVPLFLLNTAVALHAMAGLRRYRNATFGERVLALD
jgi:hypothetical protein